MTESSGFDDPYGESARPPSQPHHQPSALNRAALGHAAHEIIEFVDACGWGQPPQLFGLVETAMLHQTQPDWADVHTDDSPLTVIEQQPLPGSPDGGSPELDHILATTSWPDEIVGCALIQEIIVLPPDAESDLDEAMEPKLRDPYAADEAGRQAAINHPDARNARLVVAVLRNSESVSLLQLEPTDADDAFAEPEIRTGNLAPNVVDALIATFDNDDFS